MINKAVLYAFHFYDPWDYSTFRVNKGRFSCPGKMPGDIAGKTSDWSRKTIEQKIQPVAEWAKRFNIPASGIIVEAFSCDRRVAGAQPYLENLMAVFNKKSRPLVSIANLTREISGLGLFMLWLTKACLTA